MRLIWSALFFPTVFLACGYNGTATPADGWSIEVVATGIEKVDGLAIASDGSIIAAREIEGGGVVRVDPASGTFEVYAADLNRADNVFIDGQGAVFVTEENADGRLVRISGGRTETFVSGLNNPEGLDGDADGNLFIAEHASNGRLLRVDPAGHVEELGPVVDGEGLRLLNDGSLIIAETSEDRLLRVFPDRRREHLFSGELNAPDGVGYDGARARLFVSEDAAPGGLFEVDLQNNTLTPVAFDLNAPQAMTFEPDGAILLAEQGENRILRLRELASGS